MFYPLLIFVWIFTILLFHWYGKQWQKSKKPTLKHPPGPPELPIIGHLHLLGGSLSKSLLTLSKRYGPIMRLRIASRTSIIVSDAKVAQEILKDNEMNFVSRPDFGPSGSEYNIYYGYTFVFSEYGSYWRYLKKLCMTELLSVSQVNRFVDIRKDEIMKLMETLVRCSGSGKACELGEELMKMTNNVICRMAMSTRCSGSEDESKLVREYVRGVEPLVLKFVLSELMGPLSKLDLFGYGRGLKVLMKKFDAMIERIIDQHEKDRSYGAKKRKDVMDILLENLEDEKAEMKLTRTHVKTFLMELFMAGTETTSAALKWTIAELINHPNVLKKLREEINIVVGSKRLVEESDVPNLQYLQAVVKESLRLHPSTPLIFRSCDKDCKINGYDILAKERVIFNLNAIMRDPNVWENPLEFLPERFEIKSSEQYDHYQMALKGQNFSLFPFGSGRRGCAGTSLALSVLHGAIARLVQCFDFQVQGRKINTEEGAGFSGGLVHPLACFPVIKVNPFELTKDHQ